MRILTFSIVLVALATFTQACTTSSTPSTQRTAAQEAQAKQSVEVMAPEQALHVSWRIARVQRIVAQAPGFESLEFLVDPPQREDAGELVVEIRSADLLTRHGHGVIRASKAQEYGWHAVEWVDEPELEQDEFYALTLSTPVDSYGTWTIAVGNRYPWSDLESLQSLAVDLGFRAKFDDGSVASAGLKHEGPVPDVIDDRERQASKRVAQHNLNDKLPVCDGRRCTRPPRSDDEPTGFSREFRRAPASISNQRWVVFISEDPLVVIDVKNATSAEYSVGKDYEPIDVFGDFALFRKKPERAWRSQDWLSIDLREGTRVEKGISDCQDTKPLAFAGAAVVACFQDDRLTLHDLSNKTVIETPILGEAHDGFEILAVGSELHVLGEDHRYAWKNGEDKWRVLGPGASFADPDRELAVYIEELYKKDPEHPGFVGRKFFHESGVRYDLDKRLFSMRGGLTDTYEVSRGVVRFGPYLSQEDGQLKLAPKWPATRAAWAGKSAVFMGRGCGKAGQRCVEGTRWTIWELPATAYEDETLEFRGLDVRTTEE